MNAHLWRDWTISCGVGELLGIAVAGGIAFTHYQLLGEPQTWVEKLFNLALMLFAGVIEGTIVGFFQWRVLRTILFKLTAKKWITYTVLAGVTGWFLGMLPSTLLPTDTATSVQPYDPSLWLMVAGGAGMGMVLGTLFGFFQWLALKQFVKTAGKWITANALAWTVGMAFIFVGASVPKATWPVWQVILVGAVAGTFAGLSVGAITGAFLLKMQPDSVLLNAK